MKPSMLPFLSLLLLAPLAPAATDLPKIALVGDSVTAGYAPLVAKRLAGKAIVVTPANSSGDSGQVLAHLEEWLVREKPAVVHFNCGLDDLTLSKEGRQRRIELAKYESNLRQIVERLQRETPTAVVFANTTPVTDERGADVKRYNTAATAVMHAANVPVNDLHGIAGEEGASSERLAEAVADCVMRQWLVLHYSDWNPSHPGGPEAAAAYRKAETAHDAEVPEAYKHLPIGKFSVPQDAAAWQSQRPAVLRAVVDSLGDIPPRPAKTTARLVSRELRRGCTLERVSIDNGVGNDISALVLVPDKRRHPAPAILWLHSSTPDKNALITPSGQVESLGDVFVRNGYVVVAPDAWYYGDRAENVPGGPGDVYRRGVPPHADITQNSLLKLNLWLGRTVWGMMVRDDQIALDYLSQRPEVDPKRIGATGMSMGSTRSWWLAAVDERVAATVGVACLTRYENLILHGNLKAHGLYYFTFGLLKHFDTEGVMALLAPRPFLALTGDMDYGSPVDGIRVLEEKIGGVYRAAGAPDRFKSIVYPDTGHVYTPGMRAEMLAWFERWLKPGESK
jgi:dienelactone hydrolase/lysophospholipase L1-like esterase